MPPSPPLCKFPMPRRRAAALPRIMFFSIFLNLCLNYSHLFCIFAASKRYNYGKEYSK